MRLSYRPSYRILTSPPTSHPGIYANYLLVVSSDGYVTKVPPPKVKETKPATPSKEGKE